MELRTLRYFLTTADEGNITRAAHILHVTQPTLSRQLMELERELGTVLIVRGKKGVTLTDDGMLFRQRAEEIVELADRAEKTFVERENTVSGIVSIGATEAVGSRLLARIMKKFSDKYPLIQFHLYNEMADNIKERMDKGLVDVGLLLEPVDTTKYDFVRLSQKETWGVLMRKDHPLSQRESVTPQEMAKYPLILPLRENVRADIINWLGKEERELKIPLGYTSFPTLCSWWRREWAVPSAWTARLPFTAARISNLFPFHRNTPPGVCFSGRKTICSHPPLHCSFRKSIC